MAEVSSKLRFTGKRDENEKGSCATHLTSYYKLPGRPLRCPACLVEGQVEQLESANHKIENELVMLREEVKFLKAEVDLTDAMRSALDLCNEQDRAFIKGVLYEFRSDRSVALKVTHGQTKSNKSRGKIPVNGKTPVNGFIALPRSREPIAHTCTSIGGQAVAGYYEEAMRTHGNSTALQLLLRAWNAELPGGLDNG